MDILIRDRNRLKVRLSRSDRKALRMTLAIVEHLIHHGILEDTADHATMADALWRFVRDWGMEPKDKVDD